MSPRTRVLLVFGGVSSEHQISCLTAQGVLGAVDGDRFEVSCVGITADGRWVAVDEDVVRAYAVSGGELPSVDPDLPEVVLHRLGAEVWLSDLDGDRLTDRTRIDVAFTLLHGPFGEDGTVQGMFEMLGVRYVGAGVLSSAVCQDKHVMKVVMEANGLPVGPYVAATDHQWRTDREAVLAAVESLAYPVFVKPARGGSSIGISRVTGSHELVAAIEQARRYDPKVIIEQGFVDAREVECAVLGTLDGGVDASVPGEIVVHRADAFYDFTTKYLPDQEVSLVVPAELPGHVTDEVRRLAAECCRVLEVEGIARVDTFVTREGEVVVNEANTMPGFTETSMYPLLWQASGLGYTDLITRLLDLALARPLGLR